MEEKKLTVRTYGLDELMQALGLKGKLEDVQFAYPDEPIPQGMDDCTRVDVRVTTIDE